MKKIIFLCLCVWANFATAQPLLNLEHFDDNKVQWGYYFGMNYFDTKFSYNKLNYLPSTNQNDIVTIKKAGFNVGLTGDVRLFEQLNLRLEPGLIYNQRRLSFPWETEKTKNFRFVNSTYIYVPILLKFSTKRFNNIKPYITGGASGVVNLSSGENISLDNSEGRFRMKTHTGFWEVGFGIDIYTPHFRMSPSIRGMFSMTNEFVADKDPQSTWTSNLNRINTNAILLNITFE